MRPRWVKFKSQSLHLPLVTKCVSSHVFFPPRLYKFCIVPNAAKFILGETQGILPMQRLRKEGQILSVGSKATGDIH